MARNQATIGINVIAKTAGASRNFAKLKKDVTKTRKANEAMSSGLAKMGPVMKKAGVAAAAVGAAAVAAAAGIFKLADGMAEAGDQFAKDAKRLGLSAEAVQELGFAARRSGVEAEQLKVGLRTMGKQITEAVTKRSGEGADALKMLGVSLDDAGIQSGDTETMLARLATEFQTLPDGPEKAAVAMKIFGRAGGEMVPLLNEGAEGIQALRDEARDLGGVMSNEAAAASEEFKDAQENLKTTLTGVRNDAIGPLLPHITEAMEGFGAWARESEDLEIILEQGGKVMVDTVIPAIKGVTAALSAMVTAITWSQDKLVQFLEFSLGAVENGGVPVTNVRGFGGKSPIEQIRKAQDERRKDMADFEEMMAAQSEFLKGATRGRRLKSIAPTKRGGGRGGKKKSLLEESLMGFQAMEGEAGLHAQLEELGLRSGTAEIDFDAEFEKIKEREHDRAELETRLHDDRLRRIEQEKKARQELAQSTEDAYATMGNAAQMSGNVALLAAELGARGEDKKAKVANAAAGSIAVVQAALEQARAIAAFASLNIPQGLAHQGAAVAFTTAAVQAFRAAGRGGGGRSRGGRGGGFAPFAGGGGGAPTGSVGPSGGGGGSGNAPSAPLSTGAPGPSQIGAAAAMSPAMSAGGGGGGGGGTVIHINGPLLGRPTEADLLGLGRDLDRAKKTAGGM